MSQSQTAKDFEKSKLKSVWQQLLYILFEMTRNEDCLRFSLLFIYENQSVFTSSRCCSFCHSQFKMIIFTVRWMITEKILSVFNNLYLIEMQRLLTWSLNKSQLILQQTHVKDALKLLLSKSLMRKRTRFDHNLHSVSKLIVCVSKWTWINKYEKTIMNILQFVNLNIVTSIELQQTWDYFESKRYMNLNQKTVSRRESQKKTKKNQTVKTLKFLINENVFRSFLTNITNTSW